jgi:hypothetical protein
MNTYTIKYQAATYSGTRTVKAEDGEEAINKVKAWVRREMTLPMYTDSYKIISSHECDCEDDD